MVLFTLNNYCILSIIKYIKLYVIHQQLLFLSAVPIFFLYLILLLDVELEYESNDELLASYLNTFPYISSYLFCSFRGRIRFRLFLSFPLYYIIALILDHTGTFQQQSRAEVYIHRYKGPQQDVISAKDINRILQCNFQISFLFYQTNY